MWTTFPIVLLVLLLAEARAENDNFTQDVGFEEQGRQTALVVRNIPPPGRFRSFMNRINPFYSPPPPPPYEVQARPQHGVVVVSLKKWGNYRLASIKIGKPPQQFDVVVHIASPCLWVTYNPDQSTSHKGKKARRRTCDSRLRDRPTVSGTVYLDQISLGGMEEDGIEEDGMVLSVKKISDGYDGEMGLAFSRSTRPEFFPDFISKRFAVPIFALHLTSRGGELHIGGALARYYENSIEYHNIGQAVIGINGDEMVLSGKITTVVPQKTEKVVSQKIETVFDSTLPFIYGPPKQVKKIYEAIRGYEGRMQKGYEHTFPCEKQVEVHFRWGYGQAWVLSPMQFNSGKISSGICEGIIRGEPRVVRGPWEIGFPFIESLYLVLDPTLGVGLAHSAFPQAFEDLPHYCGSWQFPVLNTSISPVTPVTQCFKS
ncbi:hypothetical protein APHAL10511_003379 [Amanita phalloides]|nr:hypothetical protein APHAL10511_003379 [Amanita phalloides]